MGDPAPPRANGGTSSMTPGADRSCLELDFEAGAAAVRIGRHFVEREVVVRGAAQFVDDAALVAAELLANAMQHAAPPVMVCVNGSPMSIRVEVHDSSSRVPIRPAQSTSNMTGRGLALVEAVAARWGFERDGHSAKVVWAELEPVQHDSGPQLSVDDLLAAWEDDSDGPADNRYTVVLGDVPTDLLIEAKAHIDNVVRELSLARDGVGPGAEVPEDLSRLIETVVHGFSDARDAIKRQALAAAQRGEARTRLTLHLGLSAADAGEAYLAALDEADVYSRAARLLTLETPADHRLFRRWYVGAVIRQLRALAAGQEPEPIRTFETRLLDEVRRLANLQRITDRAARLQRVTAALAGARTPQDVAAVVVSEGVDALRASGGGLLVPAGDGVHVAVPGVIGYGAELVDALREERLDAPLPAATALRTGEPVWLESREERDLRFPALRGFEAQTVSMCAVPLVVRGTPRGALRFSFSTRRLFDEDERSFVLALGALTAQILERTEVYAAERQAALGLQRALLPPASPRIPGWDVASYYSPAGDQEAGGDFYDVFPTHDGSFVALVGDVMGRGVEAAAAMAQVRSVIRAYVVDDPVPETVFRRVDTFFETIDRTQLVTVLYLLVDVVSGNVRIGNAGHLPPLLVGRSGVRVIETDVGTPFGVGDVERMSSTLKLAPGESLVVITDGLVERRNEDIDVGIGQLLSHPPAAGADAAAVLEHVVTTGAAARVHDDDVTVLVLRREEDAG